jgi:hypothetical protein
LKEAERAARTCYNHLAGHLGVALADALVAGGHVEFSHDAGVVTDGGVALFGRIGIDVTSFSAGRGKSARVLCRPCLDWSERRSHLAGAVGTALCTRSLEEGWIRRIEGTRAVTVTAKGQRVFCRPCLDWSERRSHLAGAVATALCTRSLEEGWIRRIEGTRAVTVTAKGQRVFCDAIGVRFGGR